MRFASSFVILAGVFASSFSTMSGQSRDRRAVDTVEQGQIAQSPNVLKVIDTYCSGCHNGRMRSPSGGLLARQILRSMQSTRWSALIAAIVRTKPDP